MYNSYAEYINNTLAFTLPRPKMETSMCNTYFMSGEIKEFKKKKKKSLGYISYIIH